MKTFEVYSLYEVQYRGRVLLASIQADRFDIDGFAVTFFKDTFFSTKPISVVVAGGPIAVLDTEFSLSIEKDQASNPLLESARLYGSGQQNYLGTGLPEPPFGLKINNEGKPRKRSRRKENPLDLS
jgi:hypothetical protein